MEIETGKCYYRKTHGQSIVRKVLSICNDIVEYEVLHAPKRRKDVFGKQNVRGFKRWLKDVVEELPNYEHLDGCTLHETYIILNTKNEPIFRCSKKRANFYLRKNYAVLTEPGILKFTNDVTEDRLKELCGDEFSEFFMAVKNDKCACCGKTICLTRHHIVPRRFIKLIPQPWRSCLSNILFVCRSCHKSYEQHIINHGEPDFKPVESDPLDLAKKWRDHFLEIMKPKFIPQGWDIVTCQK